MCLKQTYIQKVLKIQQLWTSSQVKYKLLMANKVQHMLHIHQYTFIYNSTCMHYYNTYKLLINNKLQNVSNFLVSAEVNLTAAR